MRIAATPVGRSLAKHCRSEVVELVETQRRTVLQSASPMARRPSCPMQFPLMSSDRSDGSLRSMSATYFEDLGVSNSFSSVFVMKMMRGETFCFGATDYCTPKLIEKS